VSGGDGLRHLQHWGAQGEVRGKINRLKEARRRCSAKRGESGGFSSKFDVDGGSPVAGGGQDVEGGVEVLRRRGSSRGGGKR
jgi:hypothetical protein